MKSLKLDHTLALQVLSGERSSTWRVNDDKDLHVNDQVTLIDKEDSTDPATWQTIGTATILTVLEKQLGQVNRDDMDGHQVYTSIDQIIKEYQGYYGPQVGPETPVKIIHFSFKPELIYGEVTPSGPPIKQAKLFADGGSRGNPGLSSSAFVLYDLSGKIIAEKGLFLGVTTNNQAEYQALRLGLEDALSRGITSLEVYMDSTLVINQVKGSYRVRNSDLKAIHQSILDLASKFQKISFTHVPREKNKPADTIVNQVLDAA